MDRAGPHGSRPVWLETVIGTRIYLIAVMLVWSAGLAALLVVLAVVISRPPWLHAVFAVAAALEMLWGTLVFSRLRRAGGQAGEPPVS
jgi:hypothetical protein